MEEEQSTEQLNQENSAPPTKRQRLKRAAQALGYELKAIIYLLAIIAGAEATLEIIKAPIIGTIGCNMHLVAVASALYVLPGASGRLGIKDTLIVRLAQAFRVGLRAPRAFIPDLMELAAKIHELWRNLRQGPDVATRPRH